MARQTAERIRVYYGCNIYPRNRHGWYETYAGGRFWKADTLEGARECVRYALELERAAA